MPTYDYQCDACAHKFEEFQSFSAPALTDCPECGKKKLRRLFGTGAAVLFKGSGFYETDYRSDSYKQAAKADSGGSPSSANGSPGTGGTTGSSGGSSGGEKTGSAAKTPKSGD